METPQDYGANFLRSRNEGLQLRHVFSDMVLQAKLPRSFSLLPVEMMVI